MAMAMTDERRETAHQDEETAASGAAPGRFAVLWRLLGWAMFGLGFVGMFLPLLPTTGFWILAALAFERGNPAIARRIRNTPHFGPAVSAYLDHGIISRRGKIAALCAMAACAVVLALLVKGVGLWAGLGGIAIGATFVATRPSVAQAE